jgi:group I intron endonuclease
MQIFTKNH